MKQIGVVGAFYKTLDSARNYIATLPQVRQDNLAIIEYINGFLIITNNQLAHLERWRKF